MATSTITSDDIRIFMMDKKELNPLLRGVRFSDDDISRAINMVVDCYNSTPPFINPKTPGSFPYRYLLLIGVAGHLLKSASINQANNELTYSANGVSVDDNNKAEIFGRIGMQLWGEFKEMVTNIKVAQNISAAYGSETSELIYVAM
jgi:hypothetical protein